MFSHLHLKMGYDIATDKHAVTIWVDEAIAQTVYSVESEPFTPERLGKIVQALLEKGVHDII